MRLIRSDLKWTSAATSIAALLLVSSLAAGETPIAFATHGGDAWTFSKEIDVVVRGQACDHVAITSPAARQNFKPVDGHVHVRLALRSGHNSIQAECVWHGIVRGTARQTWHVRLSEAPRASIETAATGAGLTLDGRASSPAPVGGSAIMRYQWVACPSNTAPLVGLPSSKDKVDLPKSAPDGEYYVTLGVTNADRRVGHTTVMLRSQGGVLQAIDPDHAHAAWIDRAVVYGIVPRLFGPRGLPDVTAQLDRLAALGVTALWLSPITAATARDFGYAVTDYFRMRADLGGKAGLRELVQAAHARGMRVIMDFVPNHLSDRAPYFVDTVENSRASPYYDFFMRDQSGNAEHYFDWGNLENLNYANLEVQNLVVEGFAYWVREFDIDGFRVDAAWGPRDRSPDFWPRWRAELRRIKPELLLLAEASARDQYYGQRGFDAAYDWTDKLGEWTWQSAFDNPGTIADLLRPTLARPSSDALVFRFLENNDTGARFITRYGLERTRVAAAMLMTLPGIPSLYSGQEVGAAYEPYQRATPLGWNDPHRLQAWYQRLISLRQTYPALRSHDLRLLDVAPKQNILAYVRNSDSPAETILVILNFGASPGRVMLAGEDEPVTAPRGFVDLLTGVDIGVDAGAFDIAPYAVAILKAK